VRKLGSGSNAESKPEKCVQDIQESCEMSWHVPGKACKTLSLRFDLFKQCFDVTISDEFDTLLDSILVVWGSMWRHGSAG
jgi:hypothetical protein